MSKGSPKKQQGNKVSAVQEPRWLLQMFACPRAQTPLYSVAKPTLANWKPNPGTERPAVECIYESPLQISKGRSAKLRISQKLPNLLVRAVTRRNW
jgi:uncharacterized protein YbaR (Trm112 family)